MNILIFEYITGGGLANQSLPSSLVHEGEMMLRAVANDFSEIPNVQVNILMDYRLTIKIDAVREIAITPKTSSIQIIEEMADALDVVLIIAPETDHILASLCEKLEKQAFVLLNSSVESIKLTADKYATYNYLIQHDIEQIPSYQLVEYRKMRQNNVGDKYVIKMKDGVACEDLVILSDLAEVEATTAVLENDKYIVQPFISGLSASLSLLCWEGECLLLTANEQILEQKNNSINLIQCKVNSLDKEKFINFASKVISTFPGLKGYVGIDILVRDNEIILVEINPRLTTSYVAIGKAIGVNPAGLMLDCFMQKKLPHLKPTNNEIFDLNLEAENAA